MARLLEKVWGQSSLFEKAAQLRQLDRVPGGILLTGPEGLGHGDVALALAQLMICENKAEYPCGTCGPCLRVEKKSSESLLRILPEKKQIRRDEVLGVLDFLSLKSWGGGRRVVILEDAQHLNPQAANTILKILEEPPADTVFFLTATQRSAVLSTLVSRCQVWGLTPLLEKDIPDSPGWVRRVSRGRMLKWQQLNTDEAFETRQVALIFLKEWREAGAGFYLTEIFRQRFGDREQAQEILSWILIFIRDALVLKTGEKNLLLNLDHEADIALLAAGGAENLFRFFFATQRLLFELRQSRDLQLSLENYWLQFHAAAEERNSKTEGRKAYGSPGFLD